MGTSESDDGESDDGEGGAMVVWDNDRIWAGFAGEGVAGTAGVGESGGGSKPSRTPA